MWLLSVLALVRYANVAIVARRARLVCASVRPQACHHERLTIRSCRGGNQTCHQNRPSSRRRVNPFRRIDEQEVNLRPQSSEAWLACASGMALRAIKSSSPFCAARAPKVQCHHGLTELVLKVLPYEHLLISATTLATMTTGHNVLHRRGGNQTRHQNRPSSLRRVNPFRRIDEREVNLHPQSSEAWL